MSLPIFHRVIDHLAMWSEDHVDREPQGYHPGPDGPLACFGPLGPLPPPPTGAGPWRAPSPSPSGTQGDQLLVYYTPAGESRHGTLLLVPPWKTRRRSLVSGYTNLFVRAGFDVWLIAPPHHLDRATGRERAGEGFIRLDLAQLRDGFEQLVLEIRLCAALAQGRGPVGLLGLSLGGLAAAWAATGPEPIDFVALIAPPVDLATIFTETRIGRRYQALARRAGAPLPGPELLRPALAALEPVRRTPTARRLFIATGLHDCIVPPSGPLALARAWHVAPTLYPRGHLSLLFLCRALRRDLLRFATGADYLRAVR